MTNLKEFRNEIIIYSAVSAGVIEIISLFAVGIEPFFSMGLAIGTVISMAGFLILVRTGNSLRKNSSSIPMITGYMFRLVLYGVSFFICIRSSVLCGAGCGLGLITIQLGIFILYGFVNPFVRKKKNPLNDWKEPKEWNDLSEYDEEEDDW